MRVCQYILDVVHVASIIADVKSAPKAVRQPVTITVNKLLLDRFDEVGRETGRNRSEMIDRAIEYYLETRAGTELAAIRAAAKSRRN